MPRQLRYLDYGDGTILWVQTKPKTGTPELISLIEPDEMTYRKYFVPVREDERFAVGICRYWQNTAAYPVIIEGRNVFDGAPADSAKCSNEQMWQLGNGTRALVSGLRKWGVARERPLIARRHGDGLTISERTGGTPGEIAISMRLQRENQSRPYDAGIGADVSEVALKEPVNSGLKFKTHIELIATLKVLFPIHADYLVSMADQERQPLPKGNWWKNMDQVRDEIAPDVP